MIGLDHAPAAEAALAIVGGVANVIDVDEQGFEAQVLEASRRAPVVVDFWAGWCQPCRVLSPVLERLAEEYEGRFVLAKIDVDANPRLAAAFGIQGIPAVKAFRDGAVVAEFVGVQPEDAIRRFLDQIAPDLARLEEARKAEAVGAMDEAERLYREAVSANPNDHQAAVGLARVLLEGGADEEARSLLQPVPPDAESRRLLAEMTLRQLAAGGGPLTSAAGAAVSGDHRGALDRCLQIIAEGGEDRDAARETMVAIFDLLGGEHPLTREYRPRLASVLF